MIRSDKTKSFPVAWIAIFIGMVAFVGCDFFGADEIDDGDDGSNGIEPAESFSISLQGENVQDRTIEGTSWFVSGTDPETGESAFVVYFTDSDEIEEASQFGFIGRAGPRPAANETLDFLDINPEEDEVTPEILDDQVVFVLIDYSGQEMNVYTSREGSFALSQSGSSQVVGNMDIGGYSMHMDFESHAEPELSHVDVSIEFDAGRGDFVNWETFQPSS